MSDIVLLTGVTGYVGGRLLPLLAERGYRLRCLARHPGRVASRVPAGVAVVQGDVLDALSLPAAMDGVATAFYLVHSMGLGGDFERLDRQAAKNFGDAARAAGVGRIIYLGGLGADDDEGLSPHLRSRHEVGDVLRASGVPVIEFRASIIVGSGSVSFEMIRALVERLPVMVTPRWVNVASQPIFIGDVLSYLAAAIPLPSTTSRTFEIGGPDVVSYGALMREYARQRGLRRWMVPVPVLTPRLSSLWLGLVTPLYARIGRALVDSMRHPTIVRDPSARDAFAVQPVGVREAIAQALRNEEAEFARTRWSDAQSAVAVSRPWGGTRFGNRLVDSRVTQAAASPAAAFAAIERIGGTTGWYYGQWLWRLRGWLDILVGGVGMRRGRRDPRHLVVGDVVDCWRVEAIDPGERLVLAAEMRLPGRAWLEFSVQAGSAANDTTIRQTATFDPLGLAGHSYWYLVWPLHQFVFAGMLRNLAAAAERAEAAAR